MYANTLSAIAKIRIFKPPSDVFTAFADAVEMSKFWFTRRDNGLKKGETVTWYLGSGQDAYAFEVRVTELDEPNTLSIEWEGEDGNTTEVTWTFEGTDDGETILTIEESGFTGNEEAIIERVMDSTGGFNQVIVAAKALIEHGVAVNVVDSHA